MKNTPFKTRQFRGVGTSARRLQQLCQRCGWDVMFWKKIPPRWYRFRYPHESPNMTLEDHPFFMIYIFQQVVFRGWKVVVSLDSFWRWFCWWIVPKKSKSPKKKPPKKRKIFLRKHYFQASNFTSANLRIGNILAPQKKLDKCDKQAISWRSTFGGLLKTLKTRPDDGLKTGVVLRFRGFLG